MAGGGARGGGRGRGRPPKKTAKKIVPVKPIKSKPPAGQNKKKLQPKTDPVTARNAPEKSVRGKRKSAVNNHLVNVARQEELDSQNSPAKKRKLEPTTPVLSPSSSQKKKVSAKVGEVEKEKKKTCNHNRFKKCPYQYLNAFGFDEETKASHHLPPYVRTMKIEAMQDVSPFKASNQEVEENKPIQNTPENVISEDDNEDEIEVVKNVPDQVKLEIDEDFESKEIIASVTDQGIKELCTSSKLTSESIGTEKVKLIDRLLDKSDSDQTVKVECEKDEKSEQNLLDKSAIGKIKMETEEEQESVENESDSDTLEIDDSEGQEALQIDDDEEREITIKTPCIIAIDNVELIPSESVVEPPSAIPAVNDPYEFKDSIEEISEESSADENDSDVCMETTESKTKEKMQKTLLVRSPDFIDTSNISSVKNLHKDLDYNAISSIFFSYFFFVEASSEESRNEVKKALRDKTEFDFAEYCSDCAHKTEKEVKTHKPVCEAKDTNDLNKIAKVLLHKYPRFDYPNRVLVVRKSPCIDIREVDFIMSLSEHIVNINFGSLIFLEFKFVAGDKIALNHLHKFDGHSINKSSEVNLELECYLVTLHAGYQTYDRKESVNKQNERNKLRNTILTWELKDDETKQNIDDKTCLLLLGKSVKNLARTKSQRQIMWLQHLIGQPQCTKVISGLVSVDGSGKDFKNCALSKHSDYYAYAVAFFQTEENAIQAFREFQYIYYLKDHVNVVFLSRFVLEAPTRVVKSKQKGKEIKEEKKRLKANTTRRLSEEFSKSKLVTNPALIGKNKGKTAGTKLKGRSLLQGTSTSKSQTSEKIPLKKDPGHPTYIRHTYDSDSRDNFSGSEDDMIGDSAIHDDLPRRKSLPTSSLATTTSMPTSSPAKTTSSKANEAKFDKLLVNRKAEEEEPPLAQSRLKNNGSEMGKPTNMEVGASEKVPEVSHEIEKLQNYKRELQETQTKIKELNASVNLSEPTDSSVLQGDVLQKENLVLNQQACVNGTTLDKGSKCKETEEEKLNEDIEMDQLKIGPNIEHSEKILELEQIIEKLKSEKVTLQAENNSKNEYLTSVIKEKEEYREKCAVEVKKSVELKEEFERTKSTMDSMLKSEKVVVEAEKNQIIDKLSSENDALQAEIKNKDDSLKCVHQEKEEVSLKYKETSQKLVCEAQIGKTLKQEFEGIKNAVDSMKAKHKVDIDLKDTKIEELKEQIKTSNANNQVNEALNEKVADLSKQLDMKTLKAESLSKQLDGKNDRAESLAKLYEEKIREVESLTKINEEKVKQEESILKKSEEQSKSLDLVSRQLKEKSCEVEMLANQTQEKQQQIESLTKHNEENSNQVENVTKQLEEKSKELELRNEGKALLESSCRKMENERDNALQKLEKSQEQLKILQEKRNVSEDTVEQVKELQKKVDEEKEKSVNKTKKDLEKIQNLGSKLITVNNSFKAEKSKNEQLQDEINLINDRIKGLEEEIKKGKNDDDVAQLEKRHRMTEQINKLKIIEGRLEKQNKLLNEEITDLKVEVEKYEELRNENESLKSSLEQEKEQNKKQDVDLKVKETNCVKFQEENKSLTLQLEVARNEKEDLGKLMESNQTDCVELKKEIESLKSLMEGAQKDHKKQCEELDRKMVECTALSKENLSLQNAIEVEKDKHDKFEKELKVKEEEYTKAVADLNKLKEDFQQKEKDTVDKNTQFNNLLNNLQKSLKETEDQHAIEVQDIAEKNQILESRLESIQVNYNEAKEKSQEEIYTQSKEVREKYEKKLNELKNEILLKTADILSLSNKNSELIEIEKKKVPELRNQLATKDSELELELNKVSELRTQIILKSAEISGLSNKNTELEILMKKVSDANVPLEEKLKNLTGVNVNLQNTIETVRTESSKKDDFLKTFKAEIEKLRSESVNKDAILKNFANQTTIMQVEVPTSRSERAGNLAPNQRSEIPASLGGQTPTLMNLLNQPRAVSTHSNVMNVSTHSNVMVSTHSNVMNYPNPPSLPPPIDAASRQGRRSQNGTVSLLEESANPFENHPQRQVVASAQRSMLPNQVFTSRAPPPPYGSQTTSTIDSRVQIEAEHPANGVGRGGRGRGRGMRGMSRSYSSSSTGPGLVSSGASPRPRQPTPISPKVPSLPNVGGAIMSSSVQPPVIPSSNPPHVMAQSIRPSNPQNFMSQPAVPSSTRPATFSRQSSLQPAQPSISVEQQILRNQLPLSEDQQRNLISQQEEIVLLSSPEGADEEVIPEDDVNPEGEDDEEVSDEYMQKEMTEGLLESLEEAKKSGKELMDLKTQYMQLYEAITSSLPEKIELCKTSLNEAFRQFYGITDVSEFLDEVEIIESNVPGPSGLQQGLQQQNHNQLAGFGGAAGTFQQGPYVTNPNIVGQIPVSTQQSGVQGQGAFEVFL